MDGNAVDMGDWNEFYSAELSAEIINKYSEELQAMDHPEEIINFSLFKNKFAVFNYIRVVKRIGYPKNSVFIEDLMKGLQGNLGFWASPLHAGMIQNCVYKLIILTK